MLKKNCQNNKQYYKALMIILFPIKYAQINQNLKIKIT